MKKYHLLAPGPTPIPPEVLQAIAQPILHHRTPEFEALFGRVRAGLAELIGTRSEVMILAASGTGALEAAVVNLCSPGDEVLVVQCGKFGERWAGIAGPSGSPCTPSTRRTGRPCRPSGSRRRWPRIPGRGPSS